MSATWSGLGIGLGLAFGFGFGLGFGLGLEARATLAVLALPAERGVLLQRELLDRAHLVRVILSRVRVRG